MMPRDGGQMIETTYAADESGVWKRQHDRSDRTTDYYFAKYDMRCRDCGEFEPQNGRLPKHGKWKAVEVAQ
jgi:hypothetical protein